MAEEEARKVSAWPVFVAGGLAVGEVGVVLTLYPLAVAGLLLFAGSVAAIVQEAGYIDRPWGLLAGLGVTLFALGTLLIATQVPATVEAWVAALDSTQANVLRGFAVTIAGFLAVVAGGAGRFVVDSA